MARKVQVLLIDDIDGGPAEESVAFALDGATFEIDLSTANARRLRDAMEVYVANARKTRRVDNRRPGGGIRSGRSAEIRAWARQQGLSVNRRGRIPADLVARYDARH